jgi:formylglycine-generating enzyme required for sulfatase activity
VGSYPPNAFGLYDMHGNLDEWCADWFDRSYYGRSPREDPPGPEPGELSQRVIRGGTWDDEAKYLRSAFRNAVQGDSATDDTGFRVAVRWRPLG